MAFLDTAGLQYYHSQLMNIINNNRSASEGEATALHEALEKKFLDSLGIRAATEWIDKKYLYYAQSSGGDKVGRWTLIDGDSNYWQEGDTWAMNDARNLKQNNDFACAFLPCKPGDRVRVMGYGGEVAYMYGVVGADGTLLQHATTSGANRYNPRNFIAPAESAWVYINVKKSLRSVDDAYLVVEDGDGFLAKMRAMTAEPHDEATVYQNGDLVENKDVLYENTNTSGNTVGAWNASNWTETTVAEQVVNVKNATSELQSDVSDLHEQVTYEDVDYSDGLTGQYYVKLSDDQSSQSYVPIGGTVTLRLQKTAGSTYGGLIVPCKAGDKFTVTSQGSTDPRAWAFTDANGVLLSRSGRGTITDATVVAEQDGYFISSGKYANNTYSLIAHRLVQRPQVFDERKRLIFNQDGTVTWDSGDDRVGLPSS